MLVAVRCGVLQCKLIALVHWGTMDLFFGKDKDNTVIRRTNKAFFHDIVLQQ